MASGNQAASEPQQHRVGEHWSGANPIPTVQKYAEHLDQEKKDRDHKFDEEEKARKQKAQKEKQEGNGGDGKNEDVVSHQAREVSKAKMHTVTDPTTGKDIGVEDQDETSMDAVRDPKVRTFSTCAIRMTAD